MPTILLAAGASILTLASSCSSLGGGATNRSRGSDQVSVVAALMEVSLNEDLMAPGGDPPPVSQWTTVRFEMLAPERLAGSELRVQFDGPWPRLGGRELAIGDRLTFVLPGDRTGRDLWSGELEGLELMPRASEPPEEGARRRFVGLERLYFERLDDPAAAGGGVAPYLAGELRRLLPSALPDGAGPEPEPLVVTDLDGPVHSGLELRDFPLPGPPSSGTPAAGSFLRQVLDGTHPRLHDQHWAIYTGGVRTDLWHFASYDPSRMADPPLQGTKVLAPLGVEEVLPRPDGTLVLRVSGSVFRPQGVGWLYGTDLVFTRDEAELRYRYAVRRYSFDLGSDHRGRHGRVGAEELRYAPSGEALLIRRVYDGVLYPDRSAECGFDVTEHDFPPHGSFAGLAEVAACVTAWPGTETIRRTPDTPSYLERGWRPEGHEPQGRTATAVVVRMEYQAHQERLEDGSVILSDVLTLSLVEPGELAGEVDVLCEGHPHLEGRPLEPGDRLTFVLPPDWPSYDLWFHRLQDVAFAASPEAESR